MKKLLYTLALPFFYIALVVLGLFITFEALQFFLFSKLPPFTSLNYDKYLGRAIEDEDPGRCNRLATVYWSDNPRDRCYLESISEIGDENLCVQYSDAFGFGYDEDRCINGIALLQKDISICRDGFCIAQIITQEAVQKGDPLVCEEIDTYPSSKSYKEHCVKEVDERLKVCEWIFEEGLEDEYLEGKCLPLEKDDEVKL